MSWENIDSNSRPHKYFKNSAYRVWNPYEIKFEEDLKNISKLTKDDFYDGKGFDVLRKSLAMFGAGEEAVTEDLAPLALAHDNIEDQMFVSSQMYEESRHAVFFNRYWSEVINEIEKREGLELSSPSDERWYSDEYNTLFKKNKEAMKSLLDDFSPDNQIRAHTHYHMVIEGVLAQTGYYGLTENFTEGGELPHLPGLVKGINNIQRDEGRHIGYGLYRCNQLLENGGDRKVLDNTLQELLPLVMGVVQSIVKEVDDFENYPGMEPSELMEFAQEKHQMRMNQLDS
jgi:ribonucleoside-diphosphate reductase beta chain